MDQNSPTTLNGTIRFNSATLDERLTMNGIVLGSRARLEMNRFLPRAGATIEIPEHLLEPDRISRLSSGGLSKTPGRQWLWPCRWFACRRDDPLMKGDDATDSKALSGAADGWDLIAANFARQPAADRQEDLCRWRAHEMRRLAAWYSSRGWYTKYLESEESKTFIYIQNDGFIRWALEYLSIISIAAWMPIRYFATMPKHVIINWLVRRMAVGYLLQPLRIFFSALTVLFVCAAIYAVFASDATIVRNLEDPSAVPPWEGGVWARVWFGFYFSLTTFVTLGYGDYAPSGCFKHVTGIEALLGVTLLALFTVAWGRKLVR